MRIFGTNKFLDCTVLLFQLLIVYNEIVCVDPVKNILEIPISKDGKEFLDIIGNLYLY